MSRADEAAVRRALAQAHRAVAPLADADILEGPRDRLEAAFTALDRLAALDAPEDVVDRIRRDSSLAGALRSVHRLRRLYGLRLEIERAGEILRSPDPWGTLRAFPFHPNYERLADMEAHGAGLGPGDTVAFLGSGPLPLSLVVLARRHGIRGVGIEREPGLWDLSRRVLERLGLADRVRVVQGDHRLLPLPEPVALVMVAAAATPQAEIFDHLARALPERALVSHRVYEHGLRRLLDLRGDFRPPPSFREIRRIPPRPPVNNTVVIFRKVRGA